MTRLLALLLLLSTGCTTEARWLFSAPAGLDFEFIHAEILSGACSSEGPVVYARSFPKTSQAPAPGDLDSGLYCFRGWSLDRDCNRTGFVSAEVELPDGSLQTMTFIPDPAMAVLANPVRANCGSNSDAGVDGGVLVSSPELVSPHIGLVTNSFAPEALPPIRFRAVPGATRYVVSARFEVHEFTATVDVTESGQLIYEVPIPINELTAMVGIPSSGGLRLRWWVDACAGASCATMSTAPSPYIDIGRQRSDFDNDGRADFAAGAPGSSAVFVYLHSSDEGWIQMRPATCDGADDRFGQALAADDVDMDGVAELYVGAPGCRGGEGAVLRCHPFEPEGIPPTCSELALPIRNGNLGQSVAAVGDVDGDGFPNIAIGAPGTGQVVLYPEPTVSDTIAIVPGLGSSVTGNADLDGDLLPDAIASNGSEVYLVGGAEILGDGTLAAGFADLDRNGGGDVLIVGATPDEITRIGWNPMTRSLDSSIFFVVESGVTLVANAGDIDNDGIHDVLASRDGVDGEIGSFLLWSGGSDIPMTITHPEGDAEPTFGDSLAGGGDFNGNGHSNVVVGASGANEVFIFEGSPGSGLSPVGMVLRGPGAAPVGFGQVVTIGGL